MLYTSNYTIAGKLENAVSISQGVPRGWAGRRYLALAPPWRLVRMNDPVRFNMEYRQEVLSKLDPRKVVQDLDGCIMLCWEKPGEFCHRIVVSRWIEQHTGIVVEEYKPGGRGSEPAAPSLFD